MEDAEGTTCYGPGSVAGAVIGTFLATCLLLVLGALLYRQWRRNKGKHLVLVTDPEIVEEAYAFDNPCFKDSATPTVARSLERPTSIVVETPGNHGKDTRWSTAWSNLRHDKRRTLDDSVVTPKATRVSVVGLRSRDFTGLGFNVCGNMREGIYVKDLLHRGPASESGCIHPGDRILSMKISFRSMVYEDALTILSYASPYEVELEVESGGPVTSKPTTLMKKSVGPSPLCLYHPLFRSQSIPQLFPQQAQPQHFSSKKRLFAADPLNDSMYSNVSSLGRPTSNKSTPEVGKEHALNHSHPKFGIKVLPALDSTVHRVQNDNEHNTNLERRHSKKLEEKRHSANGSSHQVSVSVGQEQPLSKVVNENVQQRSAQAPFNGKRVIHVIDGLDVPDRAAEILQTPEDSVSIDIPSEVPAEVHNAAMAARGKRKSSGLEMWQDPGKMQQLQQQNQEAQLQQQQQQEALDALNEAKSPQKGKRKAPAPPSRSASIEVPPTDGEDDVVVVMRRKTTDETSEQTNNELVVGEVLGKSTENEELDNQLTDKPKPQLDQPQIKRITSLSDTATRRISESDTDSEIQNSFTTIELNSSDITVHDTPVPEASANDDEDEVADEDDVYRKAASLGDLSKYEAKSSSAALLERAQSLDMTEASNAKKRKAPMPPAEDINESTEDLTKLDQKPAPSVAIDGRSKLKKSSEWGTLEDAIWSGNEKPAERKRSIASNSGGGTLERSKSNVEMKTAKDEGGDEEVDVSERLNVSDGAIETSLELYNLPLSKKLTQDFIRAERLFNPEEDNALARIINDGRVLKSPTPEQVDLEFRLAHPLPDPDDDSDEIMEIEVAVEDEIVLPTKYVDLNASKKSPTTPDDPFKIAIRDFDASIAAKPSSNDTMVVLGEPPEVLYKGKKEVVEEPMTKVTLNISCPGCDHHHGRHNDHCTKKKDEEKKDEYHHQTIKVEESKELDSGAFETHFAKPVIGEDEEDEEAVTVNKDQQQEQHNISNVSVSSGENSSEDSGLAGFVAPSKTYVTEIKVPPNEDSENEEIVAILEGSNNKKPPPQQVQVTSNGKLPPGKKPPVPPRRSDATRLARENSDKQVVFVSEYKSPVKQQQQQEEKENKMENSWVIVKDVKEKQEVSNPWGNGSAGPAQQPVTSIVFSSSTPTVEDKNTRK